MAQVTAYGFHSLEDVMDKRVVDVGVEQIYSAIDLSLQEHQRQIAGLMSVLVEPTTAASARYYVPGSGTLQPLDEWGNPRPVQENLSYDLAWPIFGGGTAFGTNRISRAKLTVAEVNREVNSAFRKDMDWIRRHILSALVTNTNVTFSDPLYGSLTVKPLANGDTDTYAFTSGTVTTDTHFTASANAIGAGADNPFPAIYTELSEHPDSGSRFVAYVPSGLVATITALTEFVPDPNPRVISGNASDRLTGSLGEDAIGMGQKYLGYLQDSQIEIVEWQNMIASYILTVAVDASEKVLKMRQHPEPELQGFFREINSPDGNLSETRFLRFAGFGVNNRVGAVVTRIGNGSYAIPSGYTAPLSA